MTHNFPSKNSAVEPNFNVIWNMFHLEHNLKICGRLEKTQNVEFENDATFTYRNFIHLSLPWSSFRNYLTPPSPSLPDLAQRARGPLKRSGA